ncbi:MAG: saccharopine dehydrogenase NADP-binding domain-containing protein [Paracoccaceae bacterium]
MNKVSDEPGMRVLLLGGYGVFGGRLVDLLVDVPGLEILVAGRDGAKVGRFCAERRGRTRLRPLVLDRRDVAGALAREAPDLVVDATGPFQAYGADPYGVVRAAIAAGANYLDFADGSDFVFGIDGLDAEAKAARVYVLSGVSSFPVLTAAVVAEIGKGIVVHRITGGIAPSPHAGIGLNVMRAVLGYAGSKVALRRGGRDGFGVGLAETRCYTIAVPGHVPLRPLRFSLVDVPDLQVIPAAMPEVRDIWMGAGPVPEVLHRMLNLLARARFRFGLPSLTPFSALFHRVLNLMSFGEHRGGMFVEVEGEIGGRPVIRSWHLLAEGEDGPLIPSMAIEGLVRNALAGERAGARRTRGGWGAGLGRLRAPVRGAEYLHRDSRRGRRDALPTGAWGGV